MNINGKVTDDQGAPIAGANVEIFLDGTSYAELNSDSNGDIELSTTGPCSGRELKFIVELPGFKPLTHPIRPSSNDVEVTLKLEATLIHVEGQVVEHEGRPIAGARIAVRFGTAEAGSTETDSDGRYSLDYRPPAGSHGTELIFVGKPGFWPIQFERSKAERVILRRRTIWWKSLSTRITKMDPKLRAAIATLVGVAILIWVLYSKPKGNSDPNPGDTTLPLRYLTIQIQSKNTNDTWVLTNRGNIFSLNVRVTDDRRETVDYPFKNGKVELPFEVTVPPFHRRILSAQLQINDGPPQSLRVYLTPQQSVEITGADAVHDGIVHMIRIGTSMETLRTSRDPKITALATRSLKEAKDNYIIMVENLARDEHKPRDLERIFKAHLPQFASQKGFGLMLPVLRTHLDEMLKNRQAFVQSDFSKPIHDAYKKDPTSLKALLDAEVKGP